MTRAWRKELLSRRSRSTRRIALRGSVLLGSLLLCSCGRDTSLPPAHVHEASSSALPASPSQDLSAGSATAAAAPSVTGDPTGSAPALPPEPIPTSVLKVLETTPYVEVECSPVELPGFEPYAKRCAYTAMGVAAEVVVANPSAELVARWLVDASRSCAPLDAIRGVNADAWERGVRAFARHLRLQSSRIFPVSGEIVEDLGDGPHAFAFDRGVVTPCLKGSCRCRINSLTSSGLCRYRASLGVDRAVCSRALSDDEAWRTQCSDNHRAALRLGTNEHLRARAFLVGEAVKSKCDARQARPKGKPCTPFEVALMIEDELGLTPK